MDRLHRLLPLCVCALAVSFTLAAAEAEQPKKESAATEKKLSDKDVIAQQLPGYPLKTCVVSGEELGGMGSALDYVHEGRLVRFCCKSCISKFKKYPAKYLATLDEAAKKAAGDTPKAPAPDEKK